MCNRANPNKPHFFSLFLLFSFINMQLAGSVLAGSSGQDESDKQACDKKLTQAEQSYYKGNFDETIELVKECLKDSTLVEPDRLKGYSLLARTFLAKGNKETAGEVVKKILNIDESYQPTIEQETPRYVNFVAEVRKDFVKQTTAPVKSSYKNWVWIGGGSVLAITAIAIIASGGGSDEKSLPKPPGFPN